MSKGAILDDEVHGYACTLHSRCALLLKVHRKQQWIDAPESMLIFGYAGKNAWDREGWRGARRLKQRRLWICFKGWVIPHRETPFYSGKQATSSYISQRSSPTFVFLRFFVLKSFLGFGCAWLCALLF